MNIVKVTINPEKEYDSLRQEILKRLEFENIFINIKLTIIAAFLGHGLANNNNLLILVIPLFSLMFSLLWRTNTYGNAIISFYLKNKYESHDSMYWETFRHSTLKESLRDKFVKPGFLGIYLLPAVIATGIGVLKSTGTPIEIILSCCDAVCIVLIVIISVFLNYNRQLKKLESKLR